MSKLTVYKVSWTSPYSSRDYSEIFTEKTGGILKCGDFCLK